MDSVGEGEGGKIWENGIETCKISCIKWVASPGSMHDTACLAGWHHWLDGHESEWTPGVGDGQGGLACCDSRGRKESDTTERLIWSDPLRLIGLISLRNDTIIQSRRSLFSDTTVQKHEFFWCSAFFMVQLSHPYMTTGKSIALTRRTFVGKVMSLLYNMLSGLVITF